MLEQHTSHLEYVCVFTVVSNAFIGLECTEHTFYDLIMIKNNLPHLQAIDMMKIIHMVGSRTPFILLVDLREVVNYTELTTSSLFFDILRKPYSVQDLCTTIKCALDVMYSRTTQQSTSAMDYTSIHYQLFQEQNTASTTAVSSNIPYYYCQPPQQPPLMPYSMSTTPEDTDYPLESYMSIDTDINMVSSQSYDDFNFY